MYNNPLYDKDFLISLDKNKNKEIYCRITLYTFEETPIEYIEGKVTGGSVNVDGASVLRRTCNLSMVSANLDVNIFVLGLDRKFKLEVGVENIINSKYPEIIWFDLGMYVTTQVNTSRSTNNYSISISGKDKMCLLNGEVGGSLPSSVDFGQIEEYSTDGTKMTKKKVKIKDIIRNAVETYGNELPHNIVINDLENQGLELLEYRGDIPMYIFKNVVTDTCDNISLNDNQVVYYKDEEQIIPIKLKDISQEQYDSFSSIGENKKTLQVYLSLDENKSELYTIIKAEYGTAVGYRETELVYAGDLIANVNETLTSVLDKIVKMLGNYEYFYDLYGKFVFQKKKTYEYNPWTPEILHEKSGVYFENNKFVSELFYNFEDNDLIISFNNNPNIGNIKNDYSIWGVRKGVSGGEIPIHLRYAIDSKPISYTTYKDKEEVQWIYITNESDEYQYKKDNNNHTIYCDWREVIYQMALDYHKYKDIKEDFYFQVANNNKVDGVSLYPGGRTGYEQYYTDLISYWRFLYSPYGFYQQVLLTKSLYKKNYYYKRIVSDKDSIIRFPTFERITSNTYNENMIYYELIEEVIQRRDENNEDIVIIDQCYKSEVTNYPNQLNYWIDFLDTTGDIGRYSVKSIGQRPKNINDSKITSIYYRRVPNLIFRNNSAEAEFFEKKSAYTYINTSTNLENCLTVSAQGKSAWEEMENYLNNNTSAIETVNISGIPIYYLEPNTKVAIKDIESKVNGEYILSKISLPLTYNGTMSLTVTKVVDRVY